MKWIFLGIGFAVLAFHEELEISPGMAIVVLVLFVAAAVVDGGQRRRDE